MSLSIPTNICSFSIDNSSLKKKLLMFPVFAFSYCREESEKLIIRNTLTQTAVINIVNLCIFNLYLYELAVALYIYCSGFS